MLPRLLVLPVFVILAVPASATELDSDGDGLSDFQETHKYFTDPQSADSDGDGIADGDWHERREFAYTVRSVVKVLRPCDPAVVNDDYQDGRVLSETGRYVELEVIHYPLNTNAEAISGERRWQDAANAEQAYLVSGITTNWDDAMRRDLRAGLQEDGIELESLDDREAVERVARWLLDRGKYRAMFGTYFVNFPNGEAQILPGLEEAFRREEGNTLLPLAEHLQHEVFGKGMFYNKCYGSCTSTAVYLTTGLRAAGIPTRMVLAIPVVDTSDPRQVQMVKDHITNHQVRKTVLQGLPPASSMSAHTFNEVYVGGRWRRLNYGQLGQNTYGQGAMGMLTHIHTFADLSEAGLTKTWGWRYGRGERDDTFQGTNPYRTTELSDRFGIHAKLSNPPVEEVKVARIEKAFWFFSDERPDWIPADYVSQDGDGHILFHVNVTFDDLKSLYPKLRKDLVLKADGKPPVRARAERGYWNQECYVRIPADELGKMQRGVEYALEPVDQEGEYRWEVDEKVRITR